MDRKIKAGAVSYLNTKPLVYGFEQGMMKDEIELSFEYPSRLAEKLLNDEIDIGLVPVAVIPSLPEYHIVSDYGIACDGEVASVCLFSDVPVEEVTTVLLDYQSRTSVDLLKVLLKEYWQLSPQLEPGLAGFEENIKGTTAGLVIGDRAFRQRLKSKYIYDLGSAWKEHTGLPFVFAAWVSNKKLPGTLKASFTAANAFGVQRIEEIVAREAYGSYDLYKYFTENIKFELNKEELSVIDVFLDKLKRL